MGFIVMLCMINVKTANAQLRRNIPVSYTHLDVYKRQDYLDNNRIIAHYCGFNIMEPLPSYWTYYRCLRQLNNGALKSIMALSLIHILHSVDPIGLHLADTL